MHSNRVAFLNTVRSASAYFGLTNSETIPFVCSRVSKYLSRLKISWFVLPGNGENPGGKLGDIRKYAKQNNRRCRVRLGYLVFSTGILYPLTSGFIINIFGSICGKQAPKLVVLHIGSYGLRRILLASKIDCVRQRTSQWFNHQMLPRQCLSIYLVLEPHKRSNGVASFARNCDRTHGLSQCHTNMHFSGTPLSFGVAHARSLAAATFTVLPTHQLVFDCVTNGSSNNFHKESLFLWSTVNDAGAEAYRRKKLVSNRHTYKKREDKNKYIDKYKMANLRILKKYDMLPPFRRPLACKSV